MLLPSSTAAVDEKYGVIPVPTFVLFVNEFLQQVIVNLNIFAGFVTRIFTFIIGGTHTILWLPRALQWRKELKRMEESGMDDEEDEDMEESE